MNWWESLLLGMLIQAINADPHASPQAKEIAATIAGLTAIYSARTPGWVTFAPDAGGAPVQIVHVSP